MSATFLSPRQNNESSLVLNTPKRQEILAEGPPQSAQSASMFLGRGAYGIVIKAVYKGIPVAVKIVKNLNNCNQESLRNEAHVLNWNHPNLVQTFKIDSTSRFGLIIMERFNGHCLQTILERVTVLSVKHRALILIDILNGLIYCHQRNLLHLDIKPSNIMVTWSSLSKKIMLDNKEYNNSSTGYNNLFSKQKFFTCKLCDFGSSVIVTTQNTIKKKGLIRGTLRYMSPETLRDEYLCPAADMYSLGITMWQMKTHLLPYEWLESNDMVAYQVVKHHLRPDSKIHIRNEEDPAKSFTSIGNWKKMQNKSEDIKDQHKLQIENGSKELNECSCIYEKSSLMAEDTTETLRKILNPLQVYTDLTAVDIPKYKMIATIDARCQVRTRLNFNIKEHGQWLSVSKIKSPKKSPRKSPRKNSILLNTNFSQQTLCIGCGLNEGVNQGKCLIDAFINLSTFCSNHVTFQNINDEKNYEELYRNAWQDDWLNRLTTFQLLDKLKKIVYPKQCN